MAKASTAMVSCTTTAGKARSLCEWVKVIDSQGNRLWRGTGATPTLGITDTRRPASKAEIATIYTQLVF